MKPRVSQMLGMCSTPDLYPQPNTWILANCLLSPVALHLSWYCAVKPQGAPRCLYQGKKAMCFCDQKMIKKQQDLKTLEAFFPFNAGVNRTSIIPAATQGTTTIKQRDFIKQPDQTDLNTTFQTAMFYR